MKINEGEWRLMKAKSERCMKENEGGGGKEGKWKRKDESEGNVD